MPLAKSRRKSQIAFVLLAGLVLAAVAWVDYITGVEVSMLALYLVPVAIAVFGVDVRSGLTIAVLCGVAMFMVNMHATLFAHRTTLLVWDTAMCTITLAVAAFGIDAVKHALAVLVADDFS